MTDQDLGLAIDNSQFKEDPNMKLDLYFYSNPLNIQNNVLTTLEKRLKGTRFIADPNNSFMFLLESFSETIGNLSVDLINQLNILYPKRSITLNDLYQHISDFEYVGMYATPASLMLEIVFDKDYLYDNSIDWNNQYKLVRIPVNTKFVIEDIPFGIYYPIDIRINKITKNINVVYDTDTSNPLKSLNNINLTKKEYYYKGLNLLSISIPVYQFEKSFIDGMGSDQLGFYQKYIYNNKFYAARIYTYINDKWKEINYTLSDFNYDPNKPTAKLKILPESNEFHVHIPPVYFEKGLVSSNIKVEIITTLGKINVGLDNLNVSEIKAAFIEDINDTSGKYSSILKLIPTIAIRPLESRIVSGSDGLDFDTIKNIVIYGCDNPVPITRKDIEIYFKKYGFDVIEQEDNITERIYLALKYFQIPSFEFPIKLINSNLIINKDILDNTNTINKFDDQIVILPSTIFHLEKNNSVSIVDDDSKKLLPSSIDELTKFLKDNKYLFYPYHLIINTVDKYPIAITYDFKSTSIDNIKFEKEHQTIDSTVDVLTGLVSLNKSNYSKWIIRLGISRNGNLEKILPSDLTLVLSTSTILGDKIGWIGNYVETLDKTDIFDFEVNTDFHIDQDKINITNGSFYTFQNPLKTQILLKQKYYITCYADKDIIGTSEVNQEIQDNLPYDLKKSNLIGINVYSLDIQLGKSLGNVIYNPVTVTWTGDQYQTYDVDIPLQYEYDIYARDSNGNIQYTTNDDNTVTLTFEHHQGDPVLDSDNNQVYKFKKGDIKLDSNGNPIPVNYRDLDYTINVFLFDYMYKVYDQNNSFIPEMIDSLNNYYTKIKSIQDNLLENTYVYFKPYSTLGSILTKNSISQSARVYMDLELFFDFTLYVYESVMEDKSLQDSIKDKIYQIITNSISTSTIINMSSIVHDIKNELGDYIKSIETQGFNNTNIQTIVPVEKDKKFIVKTYCDYDNKKYLVFKPDLNITFNQIS